MKRISFPGLRVSQQGRTCIGDHTFSHKRLASSTTRTESGAESTGTPASAKKKENIDKLKKKQKTLAELDEEMKQAMENLSGDGGEAGLELEGGQPVSMKRSVRENMFRYI